MKAKILGKNVIDIIDYDARVQEFKKQYDLYIISNSVDDDTINAILKKKEDKRTESDLVKIVLRKKAEDAYKEALETLSDYKDIEVVPYSGEEEGELDKIIPYYENGEKVVYQKFKLVKNDEFLISEKISLLKTELSESDYKVIKCYEASILKSDDMPYDVQNLAEERQTKRDEINRLEALL